MSWSCRKRRKRRISIIVPFQSTEPNRRAAWRWLKRYWYATLPGVQIVIGRDPKSRRRPWRRNPLPFSKTTAVNNGFRKVKGDIIVILDSDCYLDSAVIRECAKRLRYARERGIRMWFVPYLHLYRLDEVATYVVTEGNPRNGAPWTGKPPAWALEDADYAYGHKYGAMIQIVPREAFIEAGGMDPRFRGWGGEDVVFLHALDTLWGPHKNTPNAIYHLWHPRLQLGEGRPYQVRAWEGQEKPLSNTALTSAYFRAVGNPLEMRRLTSGGSFE